MNYLAEITALKGLLSDTDYKALKHADGVINHEDYGLLKGSVKNGENLSMNMKKRLI